MTMLKPLTVCITTYCGKFLKRWEYQTTLPACWETCMQVKKQLLEPDMEQWAGSKLGMEYVKAVYCHLAYLTSTQSASCKMPDWMDHKLESGLQGEISITSDMQMTPPLRQKMKSIQRGSWWRWKRRVKNWLKTQHSKNEDHGSSPITSWHRDGETMETVAAFIFLGSKITTDGDYNHEIKSHLLLGRKAMTNLDSALRSRDITLPTKFP